MKIKITLTNPVPLSIRENRDDEVMYTVKYIPGSSFLGALAAFYLKSGSADALFENFFVNGSVKYGPLYPANIHLKKSSDPKAIEKNELETKITKSDFLSRPIPKTAVTCKRWPGFFVPVSDKEQHGVHDQLFEWAVFAISDLKNSQVLDRSSECGYQNCGEFMTSMKHFYKIGESYAEASERRVSTQISMHNGIMHSTGTVSPSIFYSIESIQENFEFTGIIKIQDSLETQFKDFLKTAEIHIGNKKTSGQGLCHLLDMSDLKSNGSSELENRLEKFNAKFKEFAVKSGFAAPHFYFSLDLFSDAIILNELLNYDISLKSIIPEAKLLYENVAPFKVMGWNSAIKLPKQTEWAVEKGSVAIFQVSELNNELVQRLYELEQNGIGIRKTEGFGLVQISDPFHWEVRTHEK
jgi:CRISPR-associated Csx10 family RAMP protein